MQYFAPPLMKKGKKPYSIFQLASAILMILSLVWLTISAPFVFEGQQKIAKQEQSAKAEIPFNDTEEETTNPFGNSTEEKVPNSLSSFSEEYLHEHHNADYLFSISLQYHKCENAGTYIAFHGELHVPPPNAA